MNRGELIELHPNAPAAPAYRDAPPRSDDDAPPALRPCGTEIVIGVDRHRVVDEAMAALVAQGGLYVRARTLVHVVRDRGESRGLRYPHGQPVIARVSRDHLLERLARAAKWVARTLDGARPASVPAWCAAMLDARGEWPDLPVLDGIADAPVLRPDGSLHDQPGYDSDTRVIYDPCGVCYPTVARAPTRDDAARALARLCEPFADFPAIADSDRSAMVALVLSLIARSAIDGSVPMFLVRAPTPGSGKGLLVDTAVLIATGRTAPKRPPATTEDELRKALLAYALESPPLVVLDNVEGALGSATLAMALTAGVITDRLLGVSEVRTVPIRYVLAATGNNVQLRGDLGRRIVPIDLDPRCEHPEDRAGWRHSDLLGHVGTHRPALVAAALTVLRAYFAAGQPPHGRPAKGSYEAWDRVVRGAIMFAGGADPLAGVERIRAEGDEDIERLRALLRAWHEALGEQPVTGAEVVSLARDPGTLHDALAAYCREGRIAPKPLGHVFTRLRGRICGGLELVRHEPDRNGTRRWSVRGTAGDAGNAGIDLSHGELG